METIGWACGGLSVFFLIVLGIVVLTRPKQRKENPGAPPGTIFLCEFFATATRPKGYGAGRRPEDIASEVMKLLSLMPSDYTQYLSQLAEDSITHNVLPEVPESGSVEFRMRVNAIYQWIQYRNYGKFDLSAVEESSARNFQEGLI